MPSADAQAHEPQDCPRICGAGTEQPTGTYLATNVPTETGNGAAMKIFVVIMVILGTAAFALVMANYGPTTEHTNGSCPDPKMVPRPGGMVGFQCTHPAK